MIIGILASKTVLVTLVVIFVVVLIYAVYKRFKKKTGANAWGDWEGIVLHFLLVFLIATIMTSAAMVKNRMATERILRQVDQEERQEMQHAK